MTDKKGNELTVGDRVYVLPEEYTRTGGYGFVRKIKDGRARVDDGNLDDDDVTTSKSYTWSAWCRPGELEKR